MISFLKFTLSIFLLLYLNPKSVKEQIKEDKTPIEITARFLKIENQSKKATFEQEVMAIRGDMTMTCDKLIAYYNDIGNIDKFECIGNVKLMRGEKKATSNKAVYENDKALITMTGNPYYTDGENRFWGEIVEYDLDKDVVNVKNIKAVIKIKEEKDKK